MKVFIWGWDYLIYQATTSDCAYSTIKDLIGKEKSVHFYVYSTSQFETLCLNAIKKIKEERTDVKITTTYITYNKLTISFAEDKKKRLADGFDHVLLCPTVTIKTHKGLNYSSMCKKVRKWAYPLVDTVLVWFYPTLSFREIKELEILKKSGIKVANIYHKGNDKCLQELLGELNPIEAKIYHATRQKVPFVHTAKELNLNPMQVSDIYYHSIYETIRRFEDKYGVLL